MLLPDWSVFTTGNHSQVHRRVYNLLCHGGYELPHAVHIKYAKIIGNPHPKVPDGGLPDFILDIVEWNVIDDFDGFQVIVFFQMYPHRT